MNVPKFTTPPDLPRLILALGVLLIGISLLIYVLTRSVEPVYAQNSLSRLDFEVLPNGSWAFFDTRDGKIQIFSNQELTKILRYLPNHNSIIHLETNQQTSTDPGEQHGTGTGTGSGSGGSGSGNTNTTTPSEEEVQELISRGDFQRLIDWLKPGVDAGNEESIQRLSDVYFRYGKWYFENLQIPPRERYISAVEMYQKALDLNPNHREARLNRDIVMHIIEARGWNIDTDDE